MYRSFKWCPKGCGKCVYSENIAWELKKRYYCPRCKNRFTKEELKWQTTTQTNIS